MVTEAQNQPSEDLLNPSVREQFWADAELVTSPNLFDLNDPTVQARLATGLYNDGLDGNTIASTAGHSKQEQERKRRESSTQQTLNSIITSSEINNFIDNKIKELDFKIQKIDVAIVENQEKQEIKKQEIVEQTDVVQEAEDALTKARQENDATTKEVNETYAEIKGLKEDVKNAKTPEEKERIEKEIDTAQTRFDTLSLQIIDTKEELDEAERELEEEKIKLGKLKEELRELKNEEADLKAQKQELQVEKKEYEEFKEKINDPKSDIHAKLEAGENLSLEDLEEAGAPQSMLDQFQGQEYISQNQINSFGDNISKQTGAVDNDLGANRQNQESTKEEMNVTEKNIEGITKSLKKLGIDPTANIPGLTPTKPELPNYVEKINVDDGQGIKTYVDAQGDFSMVAQNNPTPAPTTEPIAPENQPSANEQPQWAQLNNNVNTFG